MSPKSQNMLSEIKQEISNLRDEMKKMFESYVLKVDALEKELKSVRKELEDSKEMHVKLSSVNKKLLEDTIVAQNNAEQNSRNFSVRIVGLKIPGEVKTTSELCNFTYETLFKKLLCHPQQEAKPATSSEVIEYCHPMYTKNKKTPPIIAVRFFSRRTVETIMKNKAKVLKNEVGVLKGVYVNPSLTRENLRKMKSLKEDKNISKVWFYNNKIRFSTTASSETIYTINNICDTAEAAIQRGGYKQTQSQTNTKQ